MKGLLRNLVGQSPANTDSPAVVRRDDPQRLAILDEFEQTGISWIWATNPAGHIVYLSPSAADELGMSAEVLASRPMLDLFEPDPEDQSRTDRSLQFTMKAKNRISDLPVRLTRLAGAMSGGPERWWSFSGHPRFDAEKNFQGYRGIARDCTTEYQREIEDSRLAEHDSLTGLFNRHRMERRLDTLLAAFRGSGRSCALMMLDLDRFKAVNDTMGHQAGDELLKQVAQRLMAVAGKAGEVGRLGGDEFLILFQDIDDRGRLIEIAQQVINNISQPYPIGDKHAVIGTSVGIAIAPFDGLDREELTNSADLALYAAKNTGRGKYRFYSTDLTDDKKVQASLHEDLTEALAIGQLDLHYQPVVRVSDGVVVSFEALMRWDHPERGMVSPATFIPVAEETGLINNLGEWALQRACSDAVNWPKSVTVAVNVSVAQFQHSGFLAAVTQALAQSGLDPSRLELEVTESVFLGDGETIEKLFGSLKELGVRLALDDFGTGYSSLSYLRAAPFDKIKVDKSFVDTCTRKDNNSAKIIAAIIGLSNALGMETTVEGVEAFDQLELVKGMGAKLVQGWIYSKALTREVLAERMESGEFRIEPDGPLIHREGRRSVYRRIALIHEDHCYQAVMRDLSATGASIEGLLGVPVGAPLVIDLGGGQLVVSTVRWTKAATFGVEFEMPLVQDGAGGLCTRYRVSPYVLAAAGMPLGSLPPGEYKVAQALAKSNTKPQFMEVSTTRGAA